MSTYYIGLMSGTSLDGVDAVLVDFVGPTPKIIQSAFTCFPETLRTELLSLQTPNGDNELARSMLAANALADLYAQLVQDLLKLARLRPEQIRAIGAHGQTLRHQPELGYSVQLNAPARLAELTGISVIADFRSRDIAAGGEGAPLVPAFHAAMLHHEHKHRAVLNLGGMSNLSMLPARHSSLPVFGFDCGPANILLDTWAQKHLGKSFDLDGQWAASGEVNADLLEWLLHEPYFSKAPPKSTGRDLFNLTWLEEQLALSTASALSHADVQATLLMLTVETVANALDQHMPNCQQVFVCGGGAHNTYLMQRLGRRLPHIQWQTTDEVGIPAQSMEALAFAWLAWRHIQRLPGSLPAVTGAKEARILGAYYPA